MMPEDELPLGPEAVALLPMAARVLLAMPWASTSTASTRLRLLRASASSAWLRATAEGSSPRPSRTFMLSKGEALTPPRRVVITASTPGTLKAGRNQSGWKALMKGRRDLPQKGAVHRTKEGRR